MGGTLVAGPDGRLAGTGVMARTIKLSIRARGVTDAPTVDDLLGQLKDYFDLLGGVEEAIAEDGKQAIDWRITDASKQSPLTFEATPFPKEFGVNIERRSEAVTRQTALGLASLFVHGERPNFFTDQVLHRAEDIFERVTNGLDETIIDHGEGLPVLELTPSVARAAIKNTISILAPNSTPYEELGSIEGNVQRAERDGKGRRVLRVKYRLTGETIKCFVSGEAEREVEGHQIKDVSFSYVPSEHDKCAPGSPNQICDDCCQRLMAQIELENDWDDHRVQD
jgi:hypothetical protein